MVGLRALGYGTACQLQSSKSKVHYLVTLLYSSPSPQNTSNTAPPLLLTKELRILRRKTWQNHTSSGWENVSSDHVPRKRHRNLQCTPPPRAHHNPWDEWISSSVLRRNVNMVNKKNYDDTNLIISCVTVSYPKWVVICNWSCNFRQMNANDGCHLTKMGECQYFMNLQFQ